MELGGDLAEDAPDPADRQWEKIARMPFPVFGLIPQPTIEEFGLSSHGSGFDGAGLREGNVGLSYAVIRDPTSRSDPTNFADLEDDIRQQLDVVPVSPYPEWLAARIERQRYPMLHNAVRTTWHRDPESGPSLAQTLVDHVTDVLTTNFRRERGLEGKLGSLPPAPDMTLAGVQHDAFLTVDGVSHRAAHIDTDPHVFAIGTHVNDSTFVTAVVSRDELPHFVIELATRQPKSPT